MQNAQNSGWAPQIPTTMFAAHVYFIVITVHCFVIIKVTTTSARQQCRS